MNEIIKEHFVLLFSSLGGLVAFCLFRFWPKQTRKALNDMIAVVWAAKRIDDAKDKPPVIPDTVQMKKQPHPLVEKEPEL